MQAPSSPTGVVATARGHRRNTKHGKPQRWRRVTANRKPARDRPGRVGWRRGPQYRRSRVTPAEGRGLSSRSTSEAATARRLAMSLAPPATVEKLQAALHAKAKRAPTYRFYALYDKLYRPDVLAFAYARCRVNGGAAGVDDQTFADIEAYGLEKWLGELAEELRQKTYQPQPVRRVWIPKPDGKQRPLGIPTIRDRVVQMAAVLVLEPIFEADLQPEQYAYRPDRSALDAVRAVHALVNTGHTEVVDADLSGYFDSIPHTELMKSVSRRLSDRQLLHLLRQWLEMPVEESDERGRKRRTTPNKDEGRRSPEGAPTPPLVANLYRGVVGRGGEGVGPGEASGGAHRQLGGRFGDRVPRPGGARHDRDAGHDGRAEVDGERGEDALVPVAGRDVRLPGVHHRP